MFVADADGHASAGVPLAGLPVPDIIDAPVFSADGASILFSAAVPNQLSRPGFFERWLGVRVAEAHSVPSDWWSIPLNGGQAVRLTHLQTINLFASLSPDGRFFASVSGEGIFVMAPDGSHLTRLVADPGVHGTVTWIP